MNRVVLMAVSKVIPICFGFALLTAVLGKRISCHFLDQLEVRPPGTNRDLLACRVYPFANSLCCLHVL